MAAPYRPDGALGTAGTASLTDAPTAAGGAGVGRLAGTPRATQRGGGGVVISPWSAGAALATLVVLAAAAVFTSHPDAYIADSRFDHFWNSFDFLGRHRFVWESARGLGAPEAFYAPVTALFLALVDALGASPPAAERLLHATALVVGGMGMYGVLALFRPRTGPEHLLAAVLYAFNPYSAQFLLPSNLFLHYAVAPWMLVAAVRGARSDHPWRWAAVFALAVFSVGSVNPPALALGFIPGLCALGYVVWIERTATAARAGGWLLRALALAALVSVPAAVQGAVNEGMVRDALDATERPSDIGRTSTWGESWRGLGFWLTYFGDAAGLLRAEAASFFTRWWVVVATFAIPVGGLLTLWRSRWRARLLFAGMLVPALALMVGVHPATDPSPLGRFLDRLYDVSPFAYSFRTGYKAGAGLMIGLAALVAVGLVEATRRTDRWRGWRRRSRPALAVLAAAALIAASFPFWTGRLYSGRDQLTGIPAYWVEALDWLDAQEGPGRVLALPGTDRTHYRWGYVGDDVLDAFLTRPHLSPSALWQGTAEAVNLLHAIDERIAGRSYVTGSLAPVARRLGVRYVLLRNDLDWERLNAPRPADLAPLRADPELVRVAAFGAQGENVVPDDAGPFRLASEGELPPVEVYEVAGVAGTLRLSGSPAPLLVSGDGDAWPRLAALGVLDDTGPVAYTGDAGVRDLAEALDAGAPLVITDAARRRAVHISSERAYRSHALAAGERTGWDSRPLFEVEGAHARATFPDAVRIEASSYGSWVRSFQRWARPAAAFDGDESTAWRVVPAVTPEGEWVRAVLRRPTEVSEVRVVVPEAAFGEGRVTEVGVTLSDGTRRTAAVEGRAASVRFPAVKTTSIRVAIEAVEGFGGTGVAVSEVVVPGLDLREWIRTPDDVYRRSAPGTPLGRRLESATTSFVFERVQGIGLTDEEPSLRRAFRVPADRTFDVSGSARFGVLSSEAALDALVGGDVGAYASARFGGRADRRGALAADGDPGTGWQAEPRPGQRLTFRFPEQPIDAVDLFVTVADAEGLGGNYSRPRSLTVSVPGTRVEHVVRLGPVEGAVCDDLFEPAACIEHHRVVLPTVVADRVEVTTGAVDAVVSTLGEVPFKIAELSVVGFDDDVAVLGAPQALPGDCVDLLSVDGDAFGVRFDGSIQDLLSGDAVRFEGCAGAELGRGDHRLSAAAGVGGLLEVVVLDAPAAPGADRPAAARAQLRVRESSPTRVVADVVVPEGGAFVVSGQSFDAGWRAEADGRSLGPARALDTLAAWRAPEGVSRVEISYGPQRAYEAGMGVAAAALVLCGALVCWKPRGRRE